MTYPQVSHRRPRPRAAYPPPRASRRSRSGCSPTGRTTTPSAPRRAARRRRGRRQRVRLLRRPALRQRPAALRPPAHRLRQGPHPALPDHARPPGRAPVRLGHPRAAGRARGDAPARHQDHRRDPRDGHRGVQRRVPRVGAASTPTSGASTSPARPAGSTSTTTTRPSTSTTWSRSCGPSSSCTTRAWSTRASASCPTAGTTRPRCPNHELRMDDDVYQQRQDPAVTVGLRLETGELALVWTTTPWTLPGQPGDHGRLRHRLRRRRVRRHGHDRAVRHRRGPARRRTPASSRTTTASRSTRPGGRAAHRPRPARAVRYTPPFAYYLGHRARAPSWSRPTSSTTEDGTGLVHSAGAFGEEDKVVTDREGIELVMPVGPDGTLHLPGHRLRGPAGLRRQPRDHRAPPGDDPGAGRHRSGHARHGAAAPRVLRALLPALLALPRAADLHGGVVAGSSRSPRSATACWSSTSRSPGCPSTSRTASSASGWRTPATGRSSRNRFWGSPIPVWKSDDPAYPRIDVYGSLAELERDFGVELTDLHRPFIDELTRPNPDDPTGRSTMRRVEDVLDVLVRLRLDELRPGALPVRERRRGSSTTSRATSSSSTSARPAAGSTRCTCSRRRCSTGRPSRPASATASCSAATGRRCRKSLRNYPDVREVFDRDGADAMRWFLMSVADPARRQPRRHRAGRSARACARC